MKKFDVCMFCGKKSDGGVGRRDGLFHVIYCHNHVEQGESLWKAYCKLVLQGVEAPP